MALLERNPNAKQTLAPSGFKRPRRPLSAAPASSWTSQDRQSIPLRRACKRPPVRGHTLNPLSSWDSHGLLCGGQRGLARQTLLNKLEAKFKTKLQAFRYLDESNGATSPRTTAVRYRRMGFELSQADARGVERFRETVPNVFLLTTSRV